MNIPTIYAVQDTEYWPPNISIIGKMLLGSIHGDDKNNHVIPGKKMAETQIIYNHNQQHVMNSILYNSITISQCHTGGNSKAALYIHLMENMTMLPLSDKHDDSWFVIW